jgi:hypothetical protein
MKKRYLTLRCLDCQAERTFEGDINEIIKQIDASGWRDMPGNQAYCPDCDKRHEAEEANRDYLED